MNIKSVKLRITNKRLKLELKEYKSLILLKDNDNLSLEARKNACSTFITHLESTIDNERKERTHSDKANKVYQYKYFALLQEDMALERALECFKRELVTVKRKVIEAKELSKKYEENIHRLSTQVAALTKENEYFKDKRITNKIKSIFNKR